MAGETYLLEASLFNNNVIYCTFFFKCNCVHIIPKQLKGRKKFINVNVFVNVNGEL